MEHNQMNVTQALNVIANALAEFRGSFHEHQLIQKAFQIIVTEIEKNKQKDDEQTS